MSARDSSDALHQRVQAAMRSRPLDQPWSDFDELACALARHQAAHCPPVARLLRARGLDAASLTRADDIPAVPTDVFKLARVATHPPADDTVVFRTSGTTVGARGAHALRTSDTYRLGARLLGERMLVPDRPASLRALLLMPPPAEATDSSLGFMGADFARALADGGQWFLPAGSLDLDGFTRAVDDARASGAPVLLLATSFALVFLLDALAGRALPLPPGSRVMQTGGTKGRTREVSASELRALVASCFALDPRCVVSEYGMTELGSQAYEGTLRAFLGLPGGTDADVLVTPPWLRLTPVDPVSLEPVAEGAEGIARLVDLANVDSAVAIQTQDRVVAAPGGVRLLGRLPGAPPRGCSLAIEEMLGRSPGDAG